MVSIGSGAFATHIETVESWLSTCDLLDHRTYFPDRSLGASHFRGLTYRKTYNEILREQAYDFRLVDQSLISFVHRDRAGDECELSYSFYECPVDAMPYEEFVVSQFEGSGFDDDASSIINTIRESLRSDYEAYLDGLVSKEAVTPMRYDYQPSAHREGRHPASHLHVGFENDVRIATDRVLNPVSFWLLITRQHYPRVWERFLDMEGSEQLCRNVRDSLSSVDLKYFGPNDLRELILK